MLSLITVFFLLHFNLLALNCSERNLTQAQKSQCIDASIASGLSIRDFLNKESCQPRDFRSKLPPTRDQGAAGWCFAYVAADLASFKSGHEVSAMDLAISQYRSPETIEAIRKKHNLETLAFENQNEKISYNHGGVVYAVLEGAKVNGICLESDLNSNDSSLTAAYRNAHERVVIIENSARSTSSEACLNCSGSDELSQAVMGLVPTLDLEVAHQIIQNNGPETVIDELRELACKERISAPLGEVTTSMDVSEISQQLNSGNIVGINYNVNLLFDGTAGYEDAIDHGSLIVGQKWNEETNQCDYLLRNSWGPYCHERYFSEFACESDGSLWIPREKVKNATFDITYLN